MEDIELISKEKIFKYKVNGIVMLNGKLLALKMKNNISYCLPGGHVKLCENSKDAIIREIFEETKIEVSAIKDFAIAEEISLDANDLKTHELCFYYIAIPKNPHKIQFDNYTVIENDNGKLEHYNYEWLNISDISNIDFRPSFIKSKLISGNYNLEHIIHI